MGSFDRHMVILQHTMSRKAVNPENAVMNSTPRKKLYVDPQVQGALFRQISIQYLVNISLAGFIFFLLQCLLLLPHHMAADPKNGLQELLDGLWRQNMLIDIVMLSIMPFWMYKLLRLSHRFAGPVARLKREMRRAANGEDVAPIRFRDDDFWHDLADEFNALLQRIETLQEAHSSRSEMRADTSCKCREVATNNEERKKPEVLTA